MSNSALWPSAHSLGSCYQHFLYSNLRTLFWHQLGFEPPTYFCIHILPLQFQCLHHGATPPVKRADSATFEVLFLCDVHFSKTTIGSFPFVPPPPSLVGAYYLHPPDARVITLHNDLLCKDMCSVTGGRITYWGGGGGTNGKDPNDHIISIESLIKRAVPRVEVSPPFN